MKSRQADCLHRSPPPPNHPSLQGRVSRRILPPMVGAFSLVALAASAQEVTTRPSLVVVPDIDIRQTLTNNSHLLSADRRSDLITELSPELRISSNAGRVRGFLDYSLRSLVYARESSSNTVQQSLSAAGSAEAIDKWGYVDASASISQQSISALGSRSTDPALIDSNRTEVASVRISPYVRGRLGGLAEYEARLSWAATNSNASNADSTATEALLRIGSDTSFSRIGVSADLSHQTVDFSAGGIHETDRLTGAMTFAATPELRLSVRAGREFNDLITLTKTAYNTWGLGVTWIPTERTRLEATREHRFFGSSHSLRFEHRMPRSIWTVSDTRDVSTDSATGGANASRTVFDLLFAQFASLVPDPIQREAVVDTFLLRSGLTRTTLASGGFLTAAPSVQRRQEVSFALLGVRSTVIFSAYRNDARRLDPLAIVADDLASGNLLRQVGLSMNVSHRLTPLSAISLALTQTKTRASVGDQSTDLRSLTATWSSRLRERADLSLSVRRSAFDSATNPYTESAMIANLRLRF